jgi:hypothetical protein
VKLPKRLLWVRVMTSHMETTTMKALKKFATCDSSTYYIMSYAVVVVAQDGAYISQPSVILFPFYL